MSLKQDRDKLDNDVHEGISKNVEKAGIICFHNIHFHELSCLRIFEILIHKTIICCEMPLYV